MTPSLHSAYMSEMLRRRHDLNHRFRLAAAKRDSQEFARLADEQLRHAIDLAGRAAASVGDSSGETEDVADPDSMGVNA